VIPLDDEEKVLFERQIQLTGAFSQIELESELLQTFTRLLRQDRALRERSRSANVPKKVLVVTLSVDEVDVTKRVDRLSKESSSS